jgi:hypothetical protein
MEGEARPFRLRQWRQFLRNEHGHLVGYCSDFFAVLESINMRDRTETLQVGSRAPEFALEAANRDGMFTMSGFLRRAILVVEFLRGTW